MKIKILLLLFVLFSLLATPTFAEDSTRYSRPTTETTLKRQEAVEKRQTAIDEFRKQREAAMEEAKTRRENLLDDLAQITDERKRQILTNLLEHFETVNDRWTNHWNNVLSRLTEILAKIEARSNALVEEGKDASAVASAVADAKITIAEAQEAVNAQAGKTYDVEIEDGENLGENVSEAISLFRADMKEVHSLIAGAREAVGVALRALKAAN